MLRLPRLLRRNVAPTLPPSGSVIAGCEPRPRSPPDGFSTFTTSAPSRASSWVAYGRACICSRARIAHAVERLARGRRAGVGDVSEAHGADA